MQPKPFLRLFRYNRGSHLIVPSHEIYSFETNIADAADPDYLWDIAYFLILGDNKFVTRYSLHQFCSRLTH